MRAALLIRHDGPDGIELRDVPEPLPGADETLLDVRAAAFSFADLLMSRGEYQFQPPLPHALGVDVVGVTREEVPEAGVAAGDRVASVLTHGASAEVAVAKRGSLLRVPAALSDTQAVTLPLPYLTAHLTLVTRAQAEADEWVLVNGATGVVGTALIQTAKALGCRVIAYARKAKDRDALLAVGADLVIDEWTRAAVHAVTEGRGVDIVTDVVGTDEIVLEGLRSLAVGGRLMVLGFVGGSIPLVKANRLLLNNIDVRGVSWGPYARASHAHIQRQWDDLVGWIERGALTPPQPQVRPLSETPDAFRAIAAGGAPRQVVTPF